MSKRNYQSELAWFLGSKAENSPIFEHLLQTITQDYIHWRKNYFPDDPILISKKIRNSFEAEHDTLDKTISDLLAKLRRNFPFYSPRYIAHELSDTQMSAMLGYFAGMLYNPNNVTPEAAPVTTELEVEVCSAILEMLGFKQPPQVPPESANIEDYYERKSREEFGWAHLTSGGTIANIEAMWVARQVRYFPLAAKDLAIEKNIQITVKLPSGTIKPIEECSDHQLLLLRPNESIYLLSRFLDIYRKSANSAEADPKKDIGWNIFSGCNRALSHGVRRIFESHPPVILVAASRHYSITKAANVLGLGHSSIESIRTDEMFRIDMEHLEQVIRRVVSEGKVPLAVIATAGTTEEGAVDPIHEIVSLRSKLHQEDISFWLHIDAAWGGYMRSLFSLEPEDEIEALANMISKNIGIHAPASFGDRDNASTLEWQDRFSAFVLENIPKINPDLHNQVAFDLSKIKQSLENKEYTAYLKKMERIGNKVANITKLKPQKEFKLTRQARTDWIARFVADNIFVDRSITINWPELSVASAFLAFDRADSITIDPHKMGYAPYPAGCIAFRNDRVRSFILESAPYITSRKQSALIHVPPRHVSSGPDDQRRYVLESFSPYILEGSRAGAVSAGLWAALKCTPYTPRAHGRIVRSSLLAARTLYEWLNRWDKLCLLNETPKEYRFLPMTPKAPDTNIVTFIIVPAFSEESLYDRPIERANALSTYVYDRFSIQAELGEKQHSYSQPFFLSKTKMDPSTYETKSLHSLFERAKFQIKNAKNAYARDGLVVLRASVMSPYVYAAKEIEAYDYCRLFIEELALAATDGASATRDFFSPKKVKIR